MSRQTEPAGLGADALGKFKAAATLLHEAFAYARNTQRNPRDFAVELDSLKQAGLNANDLRWLVCCGFIEHAREVTICEDNGRPFRPEGNLTFARRAVNQETILAAFEEEGWPAKIDDPLPQSPSKTPSGA